MGANVFLIGANSFLMGANVFLIGATSFLKYMHNCVIGSYTYGYSCMLA